MRATSSHPALAAPAFRVQVIAQWHMRKGAKLSFDQMFQCHFAGCKDACRSSAGGASYRQKGVRLAGHAVQKQRWRRALIAALVPNLPEAARLLLRAQESKPTG